MRWAIHRWCCTHKGQYGRRYTTARLSPPSVQLRPYQESCIEACTDALAYGASRIGVSLPTGSGKTTVFITLISLIYPPDGFPDAKRSLIIVNSIELARQAASQAKKLFPHWDVEIEQGTKHQASGLSDVTVATYQTLLQPQRLAKFNPSGLKAIIIDEAHHAAAPSYRRILSQFDPAISNPDAAAPVPTLTHRIPILGFSATFSRHDGLALGSVFERIVYHRDFLEMIKEQWLCNVKFTTVRANIDLSGVMVNSRTGDFHATSLAHIINTTTVNKLVVQTWLDKAVTRKSTLVFCVNLAHVRDLTQAFRDAGVDARYVYSGTPAAERKALIAAFKAQGFPVLLNCAILTEGADIPNIDCIIVARPTRSRNIFAQMIGRGMRLSPDTGKKDCRIIDFVDSTSRVPGVVSTPTLFGLDPAELIDDESIESLEERVNQAKDIEDIQSPGNMNMVPEPKSVTYIEHDDPFSLADGASGAPHIRTLSRNAWVGCGGDIYILECMGKGYIRIEPNTSEDKDPESNYKAVFTPASLPSQTAFMLKISPFQRSREILQARSLDDAVKGSDTYARTKILPGPIGLGLLRSARWRHQPATDSQIAFVRKRRDKGFTSARKVQEEVIGSKAFKAAALEDEQMRKLSNLTKGEAANIISRIKHGAQARYEKIMKANNKLADREEKEKQRKARENVAVGPLPPASHYEAQSN